MKKTILAVLLLCMTSFGNSFAQVPANNNGNQQTILTVVEKPAQPKKGEEKLKKAIEKFIAMNPTLKNTGDVKAYFVVDTKGKIGTVRLLPNSVYSQSISDEKKETIIKFIKELKYIAAENGGAKVDSWSSVDFVFGADPNVKPLAAGNIATGMFVARSAEDVDTSNKTSKKKDNKPNSEKVFDVVEVMPSFPGGNGALFQYLANNIKYPVDAQKKVIEGRVVVTFIVEKDGDISDIRVVRSVYPSLDKESIRVIGTMPNWNPGKSKGESLRVRYNIPIAFRLK